jgi:hypothetical protein
MADNQDSTGSDDEITADQKLNAVVKSHLRRELKAFNEQSSKNMEAAIAAALAKHAEANKPAEGDKGRGADGKFAAGEKVDPQIRQLMQQQEQIARELKDEREKRTALEAKAKKDGYRAAMKAPLEAKGIKGRKLDALVLQLETEALREDENGLSFKSARSRTKDGPVEEMEFSSIAEGIQDWLKGSDAQEWLPAPSVPSSNQRGQGRPAPQQGRQPTYDKPARSAEEMLRRTAEQLAARGVDINEALKGD